MDYLALSELMTEADAMCRDGEAAYVNKIKIVQSPLNKTETTF
jgi:hypothetical protein